jgi:hypothetical protein
MPKKLPSIEYLHKALYYDPHKGEFFWRERTPDMFLHKGALSAGRKCAHWNSKHANKQAFTAGGFASGSLDGVPFKAAHVAMALARDVWPREEGVYVRHKNGNKSDNRIKNLQRISLPQKGLKSAPRGSSALGASIEETIQRHLEDVRIAASMTSKTS